MKSEIVGGAVRSRERAQRGRAMEREMLRETVREAQMVGEIEKIERGRKKRLSIETERVERPGHESLM